MADTATTRAPDTAAHPKMTAVWATVGGVGKQDCGQSKAEGGAGCCAGKFGAGERVAQAVLEEDAQHGERGAGDQSEYRTGKAQLGDRRVIEAGWIESREDSTQPEKGVADRERRQCSPSAQNRQGERDRGRPVSSAPGRRSCFARLRCTFLFIEN